MSVNALCPIWQSTTLESWAYGRVLYGKKGWVMIRKWLLALVIALSPMAFSVAGTSDMTVAEVRAEQTELRTLVTAQREPFNKMSTSQRDELLERQARILQLLEGKQSFNELEDSQREDVVESLAWIEEVHEEHESQVMKCERRPIFGSNRKERVCKTMAQWRADSEASRKQFDENGICLNCRHVTGSTQPNDGRVR